MKAVSWVLKLLRKSIYCLGTWKINLAGYKSIWLYFLGLRPLSSGPTSEKFAPTSFPSSLWVGHWALCSVFESQLYYSDMFSCWRIFIIFFPEKYCALLNYRFLFLNFRFVYFLGLHYFLDYVVPFASLHANIFDSLYLAHCVGDLCLVH